MPPLDAELETKIQQSAEDAYRQEAKEQAVPLADVHTLPRCRSVFGSMALTFHDEGVNFSVDARGGRVDEHRYFTIHEGDDEADDIVVDPTWQQFVPAARRTPDLPKVLIGTRSEAKATAKAAGVSEEDLLIWDAKNKQPPHRSVQEKIAAAIDSMAS